MASQEKEKSYTQDKTALKLHSETSPATRGAACRCGPPMPRFARRHSPCLFAADRIASESILISSRGRRLQPEASAKASRSPHCPPNRFASVFLTALLS